MAYRWSRRCLRREGVDVVGAPIPSVLRERASVQPNEKAFNYIDYEQDCDGVAETVTWPQLCRPSLNVAPAIRASASPPHCDR